MRKKETKREINEKNRTGDMYVYLFGVYLKYEYFIIIIISFIHKNMKKITYNSEKYFK